VISGSGDGVRCVLGRRFNRGLLVVLSRFLSITAPERISSWRVGAPGGYGLLFVIPGPGDRLLCSRGRRFNRGLLVGMTRFL
jgi:hypothetical protein